MRDRILRRASPPGAAENARLRNRIDSGRAGDKVAGGDPATAPLGTDEEAAGFSAPPRTARQSEKEFGRRRRAAPNVGEHPYDTTAMVIGYAGSAVALVMAAIVIWLTL